MSQDKQFMLSLPSTRKALGRWQTFSASKLIAIFECPWAFYFKNFLKNEVKQSPPKVFGGAMHYMFDKFFKVNYQSPETFSNSWIHFWTGICDGKHGTHGYKSKPVQINFSNADQKNEYLATGVQCAKRFFGDNIKYRGTDYHPLTEVSFYVRFMEYILQGKMDRIQRVRTTKSRDEEIWDYKPRLPELANIQNDIQLSTYDLAYRLKFNREPLGLRLYDYYRGKVTKRIKPRQGMHFNDLLDWIREAHQYIFGVFFWREYGHLLGGFQLQDFRYLPREDVENGVFSPRWFPNNFPCKNCETYRQCAAWRNRRRPLTAAAELFKSIESRTEQPTFDQLDFFIGEVLAGQGGRI